MTSQWPFPHTLRHDRVLLYLYHTSGHIEWMAWRLKLWKRLLMGNSLPFVCFRGYRNLSQYHAWPSAVRGIDIVKLHVDKCPYPRKQKRGN